MGVLAVRAEAAGPAARRRLRESLWRDRWWLAAFAALATFCRIPAVDGWDEAFYVGQLLSIVQDGDLRLQDDVVLVPERLDEKHRILTAVSPAGALANTFSIGPAVLLAPAAAPFLPSADPAAGWLPFRAAAALAAMVMAVLAALFTASSLRRFGISGDVAGLATALAMFCGPLAVYATRSQLNTHLASALLVALALHQGLAWLETRRPWNVAAFGLAAGVACANRWQDVAILAPLAAGIAAAARRGGPLPWRAFALAAGTAVIGAAVQPLAWQVQFGTPLLVPQGRDYMRWLDPEPLALVFSTFHGLVPWTPGFALGLAVLAAVVLVRHPAVDGPRPILIALAVGTALAIYVSACPTDWWGGASFGPRRLTSLLAPAALGLGVLLRRCRPRTRALLSILLCSWAVFAVSAHISGFEDMGVLLAGRPGPLQPAHIDAPPPPPAHWVSRWGPLHFAVPGFSLSDMPRAWDRVAGILFVGVVVALLRLAVPFVRRRRAAQAALVAGGLAYLLACDAALALCPSNARWNRQWREFVEAPLDPQRRAALPAGMGLAGHLVAAFEAARRRDEGALATEVVALRERGLAVSAREVEAAAAHPRLPYP